MNEVIDAWESGGASVEEEYNFLIQYLLSQRGALLNLCKTLLIALLVFLVGRRVIKFVVRLTGNWMDRREIEVSVHKFTLSVLGVALNLLLIFVVAGILGVGASTIVAIVGSAGLAVGLALQGSLSNFAGGVLILMLKPFQVGDYIIVNGLEGTVSSIDIFYTRLMTVDNRMVVIPNGTITNTSVTNNSKAAYRFLILDIMVGYETDIQKARELILDLMARDEDVCQDKPMGVYVDRLAPVKVKLQVKAWVANERYWDVRYRLQEQIKEALQEQEISIG